MALNRLKLTFTLQGPILTHGTGSMRYGLDSAVLRDHRGRVVLSNSLIKGNLLHALKELYEITQSDKINAAWRNKWFGQEGVNDEQNQYRGKLVFDPYWVCNQPDKPHSTINRIKINEQGSVEAGALQFIEAPFDIGEKVEFSGYIWADCNRKDIATLCTLLRQAAEFCQALGGLKSIGFGKVVGVELVEDSQKQSQKTHLANSSGTRFGYTLSLDRPLCITDTVGKGNAFTSIDEISGAVIKGAIANQLNQTTHPNLIKYLDKITFGHCKLGMENDPKTRSTTPSLSTVIRSKLAYDDHGKEYIHETQADVFKSPWQPEFLADTFEPDFKYTQRSRVFNKVKPNRTLVVRTAINSATDDLLLKDTAKDEQLFSLDCIVHEYQKATSGEDADAKSTWHNHVWHGVIDVAELQQGLDKKTFNKVIKELNSAISGYILGIGKTKAIARIENAKVIKQPVIKVADGDEFIVTLQTPQILLNKTVIGPTESSGTLYQAAFDVLAKNNVFSLELHYCQERIVGGEFWHKKYKRTSHYQAQVETKAGSSWLLKVKPEQAEQAAQLLNRWSREGLPSTIILDPNKPVWQQTQYDTANGFGEVTIEKKECN
ncbi:MULTISPECIES: RAMP superfamily CRISPR-associated protein [Pseudoalteromonas]|uniref:RAMP superfamily CRISPR-associated protein n=1 Tax=Pseudoalteromonas TaxID=53246 RepID=UPI0019D10F73|nr:MULTISPECIES: RAMP superfamily CRISPR-associated protein [Pseudoalteromonas]MBR8842761.1 hypothetical protein [Pseudoalteromonas sp. JC3]UDM62091.1 hypothetical protein KIJ96_02195 [Pseudoalteromonas piscicida]WJE10233.1 hypothetical protein QSH61_07140 [Pseudoalteromonas sp. JC3]WMO14008.1 hypothetical protein NI376_18635 [Pseudoalteromonas piscicida]